MVALQPAECERPASPRIETPMTRQQAFLLNTLIFAVAAMTLTGVTLWLHPGPLFMLNGAAKPLLLTLALGAIAGPALMSFLFKPGKKGLAVDLAVITLLQVMVWGFGTWLIWQERPGWLVVAVDRVELIRAHAIDSGAITDPDLRPSPPGHPHLVVARVPEDREQQTELLMDSLRGGPDVERRPALYSTPGPDDAEDLRARSRESKHLPEEARKRAADNRDLILLPMVAGKRAALVALDLSDWSIADWWDVNPWPDAS